MTFCFPTKILQKHDEDGGSKASGNTVERELKNLSGGIRGRGLVL